VVVKYMQWCLKVAAACAALLLAMPAPSMAGVFIGLSVDIGPPALPVYVQPPCPQPDYVWTPGYWSWGPYGYYWVPGTWVAAPEPGYLWTPGYWGYDGFHYGWHQGYWGLHVGYYGGINYGAGYFGNGFVGGGWEGDHFRYNTAVTNVDTTIVRNVYVNRTVINNYYDNQGPRPAFNGPGGVTAQPTARELAVASEPHLPATELQQQHIQIAEQNRNYLATVNGGRPAEAAVATPFAGDRRPASFEPVRTEDRAFATGHVVRGDAAGGAPDTRTPSYAEPGDRVPAATTTTNRSIPAYARPNSDDAPGTATRDYRPGQNRAPSYSDGATGYRRSTGSTDGYWRTPAVRPQPAARTPHADNRNASGHASDKRAHDDKPPR
jgi:hypothetical protein